MEKIVSKMRECGFMNLENHTKEFGSCMMKKNGNTIKLTHIEDKNKVKIVSSNNMSFELDCDAHDSAIKMVASLLSKQKAVGNF